MGNIIQTSGFSIQDNEANKLLHVFPLILNVGDSPALLFRLDAPLAVGTSVSYRLVAGFRILNWKGKITSVQKNDWTAELQEGPFSFFQVKHSVQKTGDLLELTDEIYFGGEAPELPAAMRHARLLSAFKDRADYSKPKTLTNPTARPKASKHSMPDCLRADGEPCPTNP